MLRYSRRSADVFGCDPGGTSQCHPRLSKKEIADRIQPLCVLVVDDNQYMRKMIPNLLLNCGVKDIFEAGDGITALDTI